MHGDTIEGLPQEVSEQAYGADSVQALQLASSNVDVLLRHLANKYDLYFTTGEPYFEE